MVSLRLVSPFINLSAQITFIVAMPHCFFVCMISAATAFELFVCTTLLAQASTVSSKRNTSTLCTIIYKMFVGLFSKDKRTG